MKISHPDYADIIINVPWIKDLHEVFLKVMVYQAVYQCPLVFVFFCMCMFRESLDIWTSHKDLEEDYNVVMGNISLPSTLKYEILAAVREINSGTATGPANVSVELWKLLVKL